MKRPGGMHLKNTSGQAKMKAFTLVSKKKTPFQKHKEELQAKAKKEEEAAAAVYADFVTSFEGTEDPAAGAPSFVRGETVSQGPRDVGPQIGNNPNSGSVYTPKTRFGGPVQAMKFQPPPEVDEKKAWKEKKPKAIDSLLEEMKAAQNSRQSGHPATMAGALPQITIPGLGFDRDTGPGSKDDGLDPNTTNLYVGNLHTDVTEEMLYKDFAAFGRINSIKIMWPRTEEERRRSRNCGFVSFTNRHDAEKAKNTMDGREILGVDLRIGWSKAVKIGGAPQAPGFVAAATPGSIPRLPGMLPGAARAAPAPQLPVAIPSDLKLQATIDRVAQMVADFGFDFEVLLMEREHSNPRFTFLFNQQSAEHLYFKWRAWSLANGDTVSRWQESNFQMVMGGPVFIPPAMPAKPYDTDRDRSSRDDRDRSERRDRDERRPESSGSQLGIKPGASKPLHDDAYDVLSELLRGVTVQRADIAKLMAFALDHAESSGEIIETMVESLCLGQTAPSTKLARLYSVSDILHNSNARVKNASSYRSGFQGRMKQVMKSFHDTCKGIEGRVSAKNFSEQTIKVLEVWDRWSLYPSHFIQELVAIFQGSEAPQKRLEPLTSNKEQGTPAVHNDELDGEPLYDGEPLDGEPLDAGFSEKRVAESIVETERKRQKVSVASKWNDD